MNALLTERPRSDSITPELMNLTLQGLQDDMIQDDTIDRTQDDSTTQELMN